MVGSAVSEIFFIVTVFLVLCWVDAPLPLPVVDIGFGIYSRERLGRNFPERLHYVKRLLKAFPGRLRYVKRLSKAFPDRLRYVKRSLKAFLDRLHYVKRLLKAFPSRLHYVKRSLKLFSALFQEIPYRDRAESRCYMVLP